MDKAQNISSNATVEAPSRTDIKCGMTIAAQLIQRYGDSLQLDKLLGSDAERFAFGCRCGEGGRGVRTRRKAGKENQKNDVRIDYIPN